MKSLYRLLLIVIVLILNSCSKEEKEISVIQKNTQLDEMVSSYKEGIKILDEGDAFYAAKKFAKK